MACKTKSGSYRVDLVLPESEFLPLDALAKEVGLTINDLIRMRLKGFEPARRAA